MIAKTIKFKNLDDEQVERTFYFSLSAAELAEMELSMKGGLEKHFRTIIAAEDGGAIIRTFKDIIFKAYGQRGEDGEQFIKSPELSKWFEQTDAYSVLFLELMSDEEAGAAFINGVVPKDLEKQMQAIAAKNKTSVGSESGETVSSTVVEKTVDQYDRSELLSMSQEDFDKLAGTDPGKMNQRTLQIAFQRKSDSQQTG